MNNSLRKFLRYTKANGFQAAVRISVRRMIDGPKPVETVFASAPNAQKTDIIEYYNSFLGHPHGDIADLVQIEENTLQWVIPNFGSGSGGHLNIFRFINMLADRGYKQRVVILPPYEWPDPTAAHAAIKVWYFPLNAEIALGVDGFAPAQVTLATGWQTAYWVGHHQASREKFYFVQDFEPFFHSISSEYFLAENTYRLGLKAITAGSWLSDTLTRDYGMRCGSVSFACEHGQYYRRERRPQPNFNILFYSRHVSRRRLFELGMTALAKVCEQEPRAAVIFTGGDVSSFHFPHNHLNAGELSLAELPDLYSQCDLALVLSGTNLSLLPLELAACKCPLVMNDSPSARWLLPDDAAYYAPLDPEGMADVILEAIRDEEGRQARAEAAYDIAKNSSWEEQADRFVELLGELKG